VLDVKSVSTTHPQCFGYGMPTLRYQLRWLMFYVFCPKCFTIRRLIKQALGNIRIAPVALHAIIPRGGWFLHVDSSFLYCIENQSCGFSASNCSSWCASQHGFFLASFFIIELLATFRLRSFRTTSWGFMPSRLSSSFFIFYFYEVFPKGFSSCFLSLVQALHHSTVESLHCQVPFRWRRVQYLGTSSVYPLEQGTITARSWVIQYYK
jgi:hypothetical protein